MGTSGAGRIEPARRVDKITTSAVLPAHRGPTPNTSHRGQQKQYTGHLREEGKQRNGGRRAWEAERARRSEEGSRHQVGRTHMEGLVWRDWKRKLHVGKQEQRGKEVDSTRVGVYCENQTMAREEDDQHRERKPTLRLQTWLEKGTLSTCRHKTETNGCIRRRHLVPNG